MNKFEDIRGVAFDLDGTLVDSAPGLAAAVDMALYALELPVAGEERVITWIGNGADILMERALTGRVRNVRLCVKQWVNRPLMTTFRQKNRYVSCVNCSIATMARLPKRGRFCSRTLPIRWARCRLRPAARHGHQQTDAVRRAAARSLRYRQILQRGDWW